MRAGLVVNIRVNPRDCQTVLDVLDSIGYKRTGNSFAQLVSLTLSSLLETQRMAGNVPEPDPFEYLNKLGEYIGQQRSSKKLQVAKVIHNGGAAVRAPAIQTKPVAKTTEAEANEYIPPAVTTEQREAGRRLAELDAKKELAQTNSAVLWSLRDDAEYQQLYKQVYGG